METSVSFFVLSVVTFAFARSWGRTGAPPPLGIPSPEELERGVFSSQSFALRFGIFKKNN